MENGVGTTSNPIIAAVPTSNVIYTCVLNAKKKQNSSSHQNMLEFQLFSVESSNASKNIGRIFK